MLDKNLGLGLLLSLSIAGCTTKGSGLPSGPAGDPDTGTQSARFFLPTGEPDNTAAPTIEVDKHGGIHAVYPSYAVGDAYYAYCPASCTAADQMKVVPFKTDGTVHNAMLALDAEGRPQVLLSTMLRVYYARPTGSITDPASWTTSVILEHGGEREITGEAFTLDPQGRPRFIMHVTKAYLGIGQKPPATFFVSCDQGCNDSASWTTGTISKDQIWRGSTLRYDAQGRAHLASVVPLGASETSSGTETGGYQRCDSACEKEESWKGIGFLPIFESELEAIAVKPSISLALTKAGTPRVIELGVQNGSRALVYFQCDDADCTQDHWKAAAISDHAELGDGVDLSLDANDKPRFVFTLNYNIGLYSCDLVDCTAADATWDLAKVELGSDMKPDEIFLYDNCTVGAWFLHSPSLALDAFGHPRVGYQARDISGGVSNPDPTKPRCVAGTDMTWSRIALLPNVKE